MHIDYDKFLGSLPHVPLKDATRIPRMLRVWSYDPLRSYNGFSGTERVNAWRFTWWMTDSGCMPWPRGCDICGEPEAAWHSENYYDPTQMSKLCKKCHLTLHKRYTKPRPWIEIVERNSKRGNEWFTMLPLEVKLDVAGYLRSKHPGVNIANLFASTLFKTPQGLHEPGIIWSSAEKAPPMRETRMVQIQTLPKTVGIQAKAPVTQFIEVRNRRR